MYLNCHINHIQTFICQYILRTIDQQNLNDNLFDFKWVFFDVINNDIHDTILYRFYPYRFYPIKYDTDNF